MPTVQINHVSYTFPETKQKRFKTNTRIFWRGGYAISFLGIWPYFFSWQKNSLAFVSINAPRRWFVPNLRSFRRSTTTSPMEWSGWWQPEIPWKTNHLSGKFLKPWANNGDKCLPFQLVISPAFCTINSSKVVLFFCKTAHGILLKMFDLKWMLIALMDRLQDWYPI